MTSPKRVKGKDKKHTGMEKKRDGHLRIILGDSIIRKG